MKGGVEVDRPGEWEEEIPWSDMFCVFICSLLVLILILPLASRDVRFFLEASLVGLLVVLLLVLRSKNNLSCVSSKGYSKA